MTSFVPTACLSPAAWRWPAPWFGLTPKQFGPYQVQCRLDSGSMGTVYRALDPRNQREVAIKVFHREPEVPGARACFLREARILASLDHPNVCAAYDLREQDGDLFLVMELLRGETLRERIRRGRCRPEEIRKIAMGVASALEAAHAQGVLHRDIKPANIFLTVGTDGARGVKLLDFGLASSGCERERDAERDELRRVGATVGTLAYMSPEQAFGQAQDARSDLFSLGAVLYEMATGQMPFQGAYSGSILCGLLNHDPVPPRDLNMNLPKDLDGIIRKLLMKSLEERMPSAEALLQALSVEPALR